MDRPSEEPLADLARRGRAGEMTIPDWFGEIRFASFDGRPLEDEELELPDHGYLVLSHAPRRFTTEEYYGWYYAHARENLTSDGLRQRCGATGSRRSTRRSGSSSAAATHAAFYEVHGELPALRSALRGVGRGAPGGHPGLAAGGRLRVVRLPAAAPLRSASASAPTGR